MDPKEIRKLGDHDISADVDTRPETDQEEFSTDRFLINLSVFLVIAILLYLLWVFIDPRVVLLKEETINIPKVEATTTTTLAPAPPPKRSDTLANGVKYDEALAKITFEVECIKCHGWQEGILMADGLDPTMEGFFLKHYRRTESEWVITIDKMISFGAQIPDNKKFLIQEYLVRNWGV